MTRDDCFNAGLTAAIVLPALWVVWSVRGELLPFVGGQAPSPVLLLAFATLCVGALALGWWYRFPYERWQRESRRQREREAAESGQQPTQ